jgi:hypothetical protein
MANLISLTVFTPKNDPNSAGLYTSATQLINVDSIQSVAASSITAGVSSVIDYKVVVGNATQNVPLFVSSTVAQILTAANA